MRPYKLIIGDCEERLQQFPKNHFDSVVTDPPYGLKFMGKKWDYQVPAVAAWEQIYRVLKPGGFLLCFAGTRTQHRMCVNIEDAGFEIRDMIAWVYGSGFPKSLNVGKAIDKAAGAEREVVGQRIVPDQRSGGISSQVTIERGGVPTREVDITAPATAEAKQWEGWGTALKPAMEIITVARKPFKGTVAANVLKYGTGGINVDGCRVPSNGEHKRPYQPTNNAGKVYGEHSFGSMKAGFTPTNAEGRWPANLIHDNSDEVLELFPDTKSAGEYTKSLSKPEIINQGTIGPIGLAHGLRKNHYANQSGSAARFFYCAKCNKKDRNEGLDGGEEKQYSHDGRNKSIENPYQRNKSVAVNNHPTVKPTDLMRYLVRLVTQPGGLVLDPYAGSGSTGKACGLEGFRFVGIELEADSIGTALKRIKHGYKDYSNGKAKA